MRSMLQVTDTLPTQDEANRVLGALALQDGYEFGRVMPPTGAKPGWRVQAFLKDDQGYIDGSVENVRRVRVPEGMERIMRSDGPQHQIIDLHKDATQMEMRTVADMAILQGNPVEQGSVWDGLSERELFLRRRSQ